KWQRRADYRQRTIAKALEGRTEFYDPARTGRGPRVNIGKPKPGKTAAPTDDPSAADESQTGVEIIRNYLAELTKPEFRLGPRIVCRDGSEITRVIASEMVGPEILARLAVASDKPEYKGGKVRVDALTGFLRKYFPFAWGALLLPLPEEDAVELGADAPPAE